MKKTIAICVCFILVMAGKTYAQGVYKTTNGGLTWVSDSKTERATVDCKLATGENTVKVPKGSVKFFVDGAGHVTKAFYQDLLGRSTQLLPANTGSNAGTNTGCKYPLPDACFSTQDKSIGLCICKPTDISSGIYTVNYYKSKQIAQVKYNE